MNKKILILGLFLILLGVIVSAVEYEYIYNPYTGARDRTTTGNWTGENMTLGKTEIKGNFTVMNTTGSRVLVVDTDNSKVQIWNKNEGTGDYLSIFHDKTNAVLLPGSGDVQIGTSNSMILLVDDVATREPAIYWQSGYTGAPALANGWRLRLSSIDFYLEGLLNSRDFIIVPGEDGVFEIANTSGARTILVNATAGKTEFWSPTEGTGDYMSISHDGTQSVIDSGSGSIFFNTAGTTRAKVTTLGFSSASANTKDLGTTGIEWRGLYLGEDIASGLYFGLDQDVRIYYNETSRDELVIKSTGGDVSIVTPELKVWDDAEGANDYVSISHDGSRAVLSTPSTEFRYSLGGSVYSILSTSTFRTTSALSNIMDLGASSYLWRALYLGVNGTGGLYFGTGQEDKIFRNDTTDDLNIVTDELKVWDDAEANNDYVSISHTGTDGVVNAQSGDLLLQTGGNTRMKLSSGYFTSNGINTYTLGASTKEWKSLYLGEGAASGAYLGLGQEARIWHDSTDNTTNYENKINHTDIVTPSVRIWDESEGTGDYVELYHDGTDAFVGGASGQTYLTSSGGIRFIVSTTGFFPTVVGTENLGSGTYEWKGIYAGEDALSGLYLGLEQNWNLRYNETNADTLELQGDGLFSIQNAAGTDRYVFNTSSTQGGVTIDDEAGNAVCMRCWSDRVCNNTGGAC